mmetsp:Transcript_19743/g.29312  ORF Transcript_19743/g.29312 Transcript_19743/m.29312 type:complete len:472 (+) Transcript_19743:116-1531(+)
MTIIRKLKLRNPSRNSFYTPLKILTAFFGAAIILIWEGWQYKGRMEHQLSFQTKHVETHQFAITLQKSLLPQKVEKGREYHALDGEETLLILNTNTKQVDTKQFGTSAVATVPKPSLLQKEENKEKDGLDEEKIAIVLFTHLSSTSSMERFIFPALETYFQNETEPLFLVMTNQWKDTYKNLCQSYSTYCDRLKILWVDCPEGYFGESPCCKQEKGLLELLKLERSYDWILFADDDTYFPMKYLKKLLLWRIRPSHNSTSQILFTGNGLGARQLGQFGYMKPWTTPYLCSPDYRYPWGQPVIYSKASLNLIKRGFELGGLVKQCLEYNVTHDAGNAIFHWMYGIPDIAIQVQTFAEEGPRASDVLAIHGIDRIYKDKRTLTMHQVHSSISPHFGWKKYHRQVRVRPGFNQTSTFQQFGHPSTWMDEWHTMPRVDCMDEETRQKAIKLFGGLEKKKKIVQNREVMTKFKLKR